VWLAPTEILANQHFENVKKLLPNIKIGLLTSANKKTNLKEDDLIIGTHALIQKDVQIPNLGLIIVDEQHRFGVKQRAHLRTVNPTSEVGSNRSKEIIPHLLSMTATPIPRTMALALYGDLDLSVINEMPKGRQKIITHVVPPTNRAKAYQFIGKEVHAGRQVFVVCPLIEPKENLNPPAGEAGINLFDMDRKSAVAEYQKLSKEIFPHLKIGLLHGRLKSKEKEETMKKFAAAKIDILVSTAVVEVGIDIPNATVMMIEGAERFGLAQLHQFRGRVGRGEHQSYCFLFAEAWSENTKKRLSAMINCHSGFELAEIDLLIRGPGELAGIRQSGLPDLRMASLRDIILIKKARQAAEQIIEQGLDKYPRLIEKLKEFELTRHLE
jgi:ATP-dependent DNA helicase RecG